MFFNSVEYKTKLLMELSRISTAPYRPQIRRVSRCELESIPRIKSINRRISTVPYRHRTRRLSKETVYSFPKIHSHMSTVNHRFHNRHHRKKESEPILLVNSIQ